MRKLKMATIMAFTTIILTGATQRPVLTIDRNMLLKLTGQTNIFYRFQASRDLENWNPLGTYFLLSATPHSEQLAKPIDWGQYYYRASMYPSNWVTMNNSYVDPCAEHDNVSVIFRKAVTKFSIIATHPTAYTVTDYTCQENWSGCGKSLVDTKSLAWTTNYYRSSYYTWINVFYEAAFWRPQGMSIYINGKLVSGLSNMHRIDIGREITPGGGSSPGYFSLYADGYLRLIPFPPTGHSSVCFGSSVLVGPAVVSDRPYADILSVDVKTASQYMVVTYRSGGKATIYFNNVTRTSATVIVNVSYPTTNSLCIFRSNFVADGNSDCDHVVWYNTNGVKMTNSIMSFAGTTGTNWSFFKERKPSQRESGANHMIKLN